MSQATSAVQAAGEGAAFLEVRHLSAGYDSASQVLFDLSFTIRAHQVTTLLGRNGMGKTTTVRAVLGLTPSMGGTVRFCGERVDGRSADQIARMGMALVPEGRMIFPTLSVRENLMAFESRLNITLRNNCLSIINSKFPLL